jgi:chromate transporter
MPVEIPATIRHVGPGTAKGQLRAGVPQPAFTKALRFWFKLGWITFGGTAAHIAVMHDELVQKKRWISNGEFFHALSLCMILPGPEAQQLAIYIGWKLHGKRGGVVAGSLFVLPSMLVLLALSLMYARFGNLPLVAAMFNGLKPAVIALVVAALHRVASTTLRGPVEGSVAAAAFTAMFFFKVSLVPVILSTVVLGILLWKLWPQLLHRPGEVSDEDDEEAYYISPQHEMPAQSASLLKPIAKLTTVVLLLWFLPMPVFYFFTGDFHFWRTLVLFFTKTAFVTIGGSYTVLPYVAHVAVTQFHWLSRAQMTDGFALAETTPGPLIIVVAFVGFMAAYNHFHGSLWMGTVALLATTFYTFLPCFLFVFAGAPLVERTHGKPMIRGVLRLITAVVVAAILDLVLFLGKAVFFPSGAVTLRGFEALSLAWTMLCLVLLQRFKLNLIYLILVSSAVGVIRYLAGV